MALHFLAESAFDDLLTAWRQYARVRDMESMTVPQLGKARIELDEARERMNKIRIAMYPSEEERDSSLVVALCPVLDEVVHLSWTHRSGAGSQELHCPCGELVPAPSASPNWSVA